MFSNIGAKIKVLAQIIAWAGIFISVIGGLALINQGTGNYYGSSGILVIVGFGIMFIGSLISWISSWFMYGFGELIEKTTVIAKNSEGENSKSDWICKKCQAKNPPVHLWCDNCGTKNE